MDRTIIAQQTKVETDLLDHLLDGIRATLDWDVSSRDLPRQVSTLRFLAQCLQRHLDHLMSLEECDGYMDLVMAASPQLGNIVDGLRHEHETFRSATSRIVLRLDRVSPTDSDAFFNIAKELDSLLRQLDEHGQKEADLILQAFDQEEGGEG
jgi:hemerythrin-like domain-containing protein